MSYKTTLRYQVDNDVHSVSVTGLQKKLLLALQRGAVVYRPARRRRKEHHLVGRVKIEEAGKPQDRVQDRVPDQLVSMGLLDVTASRAPGGFRLDYMIPQGIKLLDAAYNPA